MVNPDELLATITDNTLTHKDKIVFITSQILSTTDPRTISNNTNISIQSVRQSLAKSDTQIIDDFENQETVIDALIDVCGIERQSMRQKDWSSLNKTASALVDAGATGEEVRTRASQYKRKFQNAAVTPAALDKYWAMLAAQTKFTPSTIYG